MNLSVLLTPALATLLVAAGGADGTVSNVCDAQSLRLVEAPGKTLADVSLTASPHPFASIRFSGSQTIAEPCGDEVVKSSMRQFQLRDGRVLGLLGGGQGYSRPLDQSVIGGFIPAKDPPALGRLKPVQTIQIHADSRARLKVYVGLWSDERSSVVATMAERGGVAERPRPVVSSSRLVRGIGYFPSPDSNLGGLAIVQTTDTGTLLISLSLNTDGWARQVSRK